MTFLEKAKELNPNLKLSASGTPLICPNNLGLEVEGCPKGMDCSGCWNREMPDTEPKGVDANYKQGLLDGYNLVARINDYTYEQLSEIFGMVSLRYILKTFTPEEAVAKMEEYENGKIEVGDVVYNEKYGNGVITSIDYDLYTVLFANGDAVSFNGSGFKKTGRKMDVKSFLEQIGE